MDGHNVLTASDISADARVAGREGAAAAEGGAALLR
jgi:hypothetical protein